MAPEAEAARKQWLDDHALQPIKEQKEEKPPLEKGDGAAASAEKPRLEKGAMEMKERLYDRLFCRYAFLSWS